MSEPAQPWYAAGLRFECGRCGACCTGAPGVVTVEPDEVEPLAAALGMTPAALVRELLRPVGQELRLYEWPNGDCVLFEPETRGCRAYAARPRQCRTWPFWERNLQNRDAWRAVAAECPGCDQGPTFDLGEIQRRARGER